MNFALISRLLGTILFFFSLSMATMFPFAFWYHREHNILHIFESMAIGVLISGILFFLGRKAKGQLYRRESLAVVALSWILVSAFGAIPFLLGGLADTYTDAYFEAISGLTTTGASILTDIEAQPHALLFWRSYLHFLGGLGIIVFFVAILPILGVGGKSLYKQEVPGPVPEGLTPRIKDTAIKLIKVYIALNIIETIILLFCGMDFFQAINHALATMATGGYSTQGNSIAAFTPIVEWVIIIFMFLAGTNFALHLRFVEGDYKVYWKSTEFRCYIGVVAFFALGFMGVLYLAENQSVSEPGKLNFRDSLFTTLTIITTTGFGTVDFNAWPPVCRAMIILLMFLGGMAGSTAGGIKVIRWMILMKSGVHQIAGEAAPRRVRRLKIDGRVLDQATQTSTLSFFFVYCTIFIFGSIIVTLLMPQQDIVTSVTAVIACLNNIGPGLEAVGPTANYATQSDLCKWVLSFLMLLGRLELYAVLVVLAPGFWFRRF